MDIRFRLTLEREHREPLIDAIKPGSAPLIKSALEKVVALAGQFETSAAPDSLSHVVVCPAMEKDLAKEVKGVFSVYRISEQSNYGAICVTHSPY